MNQTANATTASPHFQARHITGLDTLRGVLAVFVVVNHSHFGDLKFPAFENPALRTASWLFEISFGGQARVVLFFVVSGFCIHRPHATGKPLIGLEFFARRLIRIGLPLIAALALGWLAGLRSMSLIREPGPFGVPMWSLWCEIFYYLAYPALFLLIRRFGSLTVLAWSLAPALAVFFATQQWDKPAFFHNGGPFFWLTALMGLPFWMAGVWLVEKLKQDSSNLKTEAPSRAKIWLFRAFVYFAQGAGVFLAYRFAVGLPATLLLSIPLFVIWMRLEYYYFASRREARWLAWLGSISYSIFLIHLTLLDVLKPWNGMAMPLALKWITSFGVIIFCSWIFYRLIELPTHRLAQAVGRGIKRRIEEGARVGQREEP